jgi:hypothetical protein
VELRRREIICQLKVRPVPAHNLSKEVDIYGINVRIKVWGLNKNDERMVT